MQLYISESCSKFTAPRLVLLFVAFHPSIQEVNKLIECIRLLPQYIRVAIVANDFTLNEPVEDLVPYVDIFVKNKSNLGYGRAINLLLSQLPYSPQYISAMNTDLSWKPGTFDTMLRYIDAHDDIVMLVPRVCDLNGDTQMLCKQNPTLFGLISRRFIPKSLKCQHIIRYDKWYVNSHLDYNKDMM